MSDLISRHDAIEALTKANLQKHMDSVQDDGQENRSAIRIIMGMPAIDVVERNKGEWKHDKDDNLVSGYCSCCGWTAMIMETDVADMPFCPNCGADLRKRMDCFCCDGKNTMVYVQSRFNGHKRGFCTKCGSSFIE